MLINGPRDTRSDLGLERGHTVIQTTKLTEQRATDGEGFDSDWNSRNTVIQYNYSHDNDGAFC